MTENNAVVAIYKSHLEAEAAIKELQQSGFDMKKLSIVGRDYHTNEHVIGYYTTGDRMKYWGSVGAFWGWIWGCLFGSALFVIPGVGPLLLARPVVGWLLGAFGEAVLVGGLSALGAGPSTGRGTNHHWRGRLRRIFSDRLGLASGMPAPGD
jgi:hypothetical protein